MADTNRTHSKLVARVKKSKKMLGLWLTSKVNRKYGRVIFSFNFDEKNVSLNLFRRNYGY